MVFLREVLEWLMGAVSKTAVEMRCTAINSWVRILPALKKYLKEGLALLTEIVYIIYMKERIARAMVAEKEVRFLCGLCCSGER